MTARHWIAALSLATTLLIDIAAFAQTPPVPAPRPAERMPASEQSVPPVEAPAVDAAPPPQSQPTPAELAAAALAVEKQPVHLSAKITEEGAVIPEGLVWRIFETKTDESGNLVLANRSEDASANIQLAPGEYVVHVAYGQAQASDSLIVEPGQNDKSIIIDAGALRLNAAVTGDVAVPINLLRFDLFTAAPNENDRDLIAEAVRPNDIVTLNAGTYHVVSYFGVVNAVVRADLRVEPGQLTDATLYHRAAQVSFKLVTEAGGEAIADVEWTIKADDGTTVFSAIGAFPATVLAEGDYLVLVKRGDNVYNREFEVIAGPPREIEVLTAVY